MLCIKRFRRPLLVNRIAYTFFRPTKAQRAYENALILESKGINTPTAVAYIIRSQMGLIADSYLVTLYCTFDRIMREYTLNYPDEL